MAKPASDLTPKARRTRASLIEAARVVIGQEGVSGVTVMEVCDRAMVGRTSFYNYFEDADQLIWSVVEETSQSLKNQFDALHEGQSRGLARLERCLEMILNLAVDDRETAMLITSLSQNTHTKPKLLNQEIEKELAGANRTGELSLTDEKRESLTQFLAITTMAICRELALGSLGKDQITPQVGIMISACRSE
ncbi:MAG: TetR/AcrR family transcriptional regulator [Hyphomicrobiales bacterium]